MESSTEELAGPAAPLAPAETGRAAAARGAPAVATLLGLVLALAGIFAAPEHTTFTGLASRVSVALPEWFGIAVLASLLLAGTIFTALVMPRPRARRKKGDNDFEMYHEPRRVPPLLGAALILLALAPGAALTGALFWFGGGNPAVGFDRAASVGHQLSLGGPPGAAASAPQDVRKPASPVTTALLATVAGLAGFGALAFVAWLALGDRWLRRQPLDDRYRAEVAQAVDASLEELELEADGRAAILKIYRNFERVLAVAAVTRRPWQTPTEFMRAALAKLPLPPQSAAELTRLFEFARFSDHPVGTDERDRAWRSLLAIRARLNSPGSPSDGRLP